MSLGARVAALFRRHSRPMWAAPSRVLPMHTTVEFDREPPPEWQDALRAVAPLSDRQSGLAIHFETGDRWQPVNRWIIWQLQPWPFVRPEVQRELQGPHPRRHARLEYSPRTVNGKTTLRPSVRGGPCRFVDRRTWEIHQHYAAQGVLVGPRRFWVIQGDGGGHPYQIEQADETMRLALGLPADVPSAGDVPYAPFDQRVLDGIREYDLARFAFGGNPATQAVRARVARWDATEREANRLRYAKETAEWTHASEGLGWLMRRDGMHHHRWHPVGHTARAVDPDVLEHDYITDTLWGNG